MVISNTFKVNINTMKKAIYNEEVLKVLFFAIVIITSNIAAAQVFMEVQPGRSPRDPMIQVYGADGLQVKVPYEKVRGTAFWSDDWILATLTGETSKETWVRKTKLNFATGEVYFLDNQNQELVADNGTVKKIAFHIKGDTGITDAVFIYNYQTAQVNNKMVNSYLEQLNSGKYQLLKLCNRRVSTADSMFGTLKRYYFADEIKYFIAHNQKTEPVKKLSKENILVYFPVSSGYSEWVAQNKIDFRKEEQIISFLDYYNSKN